MKRSKEGRGRPGGADYTNGKRAENGAQDGCSQIAGKASAGPVPGGPGGCAQGVHDAVDGAWAIGGAGRCAYTRVPSFHPDREP